MCRHVRPSIESTCDTIETPVIASQVRLYNDDETSINLDVSAVVDAGIRHEPIQWMKQDPILE